MNPVIFIILLSLAGVIGDSFLKLAGGTSKPTSYLWFVVGFGIYSSTAFGWFYVMKHIKLSSLGIIYSISTALLLVIIGLVFFHEKLNFYEIVGVGTAMLSIFLLSRFL